MANFDVILYGTSAGNIDANKFKNTKFNPVSYKIQYSKMLYFKVYVFYVFPKNTWMTYIRFDGELLKIKP